MSSTCKIWLEKVNETVFGYMMLSHICRHEPKANFKLVEALKVKLGMKEKINFVNEKKKGDCSKYLSKTLPWSWGFLGSSTHLDMEA